MENRKLLAVINVTSLADNLTVDSRVTLREAILAANTNSSVDGSQAGSAADTITFDASLAGKTIFLSIVGDNTYGVSALRIGSDITIVGNSDEGITIARKSVAEDMRLFHIPSFGDLTLRNVTLSGGRAMGGFGGNPGGGGGAGLGGAIANEGSLTIENSVLADNQARGGQGGAVGFGSGGFGGDGGDGSFGGGGGGGGFNGSGGIGGNGGKGGFGGGGGGGGGSSSGFFGIGGTGGFGAGDGGDGTTNSIAAGGGGGGFGGAIFNDGGNVDVINSTISGNQAIGGTAGGIGATAGQGMGGGIFNYNGTITVLNGTFSNNTANQGGGGIYNLGDNSTATAQLINTIVANSQGFSKDFLDDTINGGDTTTSGDHNLIEKNDGFLGGIVSSSDPKLDSLADNGGPTFTHALERGSKALNAGKNTGAPSTDQRGFTRPVNTTVDIGAYENQNPAVFVNNATVVVDEGSQTTNSGSFTDVDVNDDITITASVGTIAPPTSGNSGSWSWSFTPTSGPIQSQIVTITAVDSHSATSNVTFTLTVNNVAPVITLVGPNLANEGQTRRYTFTTVDPGADTFTIVTTTGGSSGTVSNVAFNSATGTGSFDVQFGDGPATSTVLVQLKDSDGALSNESKIDVLVGNVAPAVTLNGPATANNGATKHYTFTTLDPGVDAFTLVSTTGGSVGIVSNVVFTSATGEGSFDVAFGNGPATSTVSVQVQDSDGDLSALSSIDVAVGTPSFPWHNSSKSLDVSNDSFIAPNDVLLVINELNRPRWGDSQGVLPNPPPSGPFPYLDVIADNIVAPNDVLAIINHLNGQVGAEGETAPTRPAKGLDRSIPAGLPQSSNRVNGATLLPQGSSDRRPVDMSPQESRRLGKFLGRDELFARFSIEDMDQVLR